MKRISGRLEGLLLILIGIATGGFALCGNYELLMNRRFLWVTLAGSVIVLFLGLALLYAPRRRWHGTDIAVFAVFALLVAIARPDAHNVNALMVPNASTTEGVPLVIGNQPYTFIGIQELNRYIVSGEGDYEDQHIVLTGILKNTPELDAAGHFAVVRPLSICCAADAILVGIRAEGSADAALADQWVNLYGRLTRVKTPLPRPKIRHGATRYAAIATIFTLKVDRVIPYIRLRPKANLMERLAAGNYTVFVRLAAAARLPETLKRYDLATVLAPVDAAFDDAEGGFVENLLKAENHAALREFVHRHVLPENLMESDLRQRSSVETVSGQKLAIHKVNGKLRIGGARLLFKNTEAKDGVIHAIYPVLDPE